ncbi:MAG TPA: BMP family protein [Gemmatimonadaceae bacterium]|nr:BMP family protein [Gemmatimonadaceae bacterium]
MSAFALAALAACSGGDQADTGAEAGTATFRGALLTPGPISDQAWNAGAYAGLLAIRDSLGAEVSHIQTKTPAEFEENFRQYGAQGYRLVVGHGFEFQDAAARVAPDFPNTVFACTSGNLTGPNLAGMNFAFEEASFQAGMIAAHLSKTGIVGAIGGTELPPVRASFIAFERGAKLVRPDITVLTAYLGTWDDVAAGKEQALAQIARGADILFQNADAAGLGIFAAAREKNVLAFGANANQNDLAPDHIIGSVYIDLPKALLYVAREAQRPDFTGSVYQLGLRAGVVSLVMNPRFTDRIPAELQARVDSVGTAIIEGRFHDMDDVLQPADRN